jgi:hypothetical protein
MLNCFPILKRNGAHLVGKKTFEKNKDCPFSKFECFEHVKKKLSFVSSFEHINFAINEKHSKNIYDNPNYYVSFFIFQTCKNVV